MSNLQETIDFASLGLDEYEENQSVKEVVNDLINFFGNPVNCHCQEGNCIKNIGFKRFFERFFEVKGLEYI